MIEEIEMGTFWTFSLRLLAVTTTSSIAAPSAFEGAGFWGVAEADVGVDALDPGEPGWACWANAALHIADTLAMLISASRIGFFILPPQGLCFAL